ncbi:MAG: Serine/threonine-protein kinase StkP [Candidatus Hydrogenedentes bacterium ADurb.Bin179]|nr:MAG: Serine/threonine-protein kinase StkP [Candidatus Hydrogenedentes bacterium ADurb.Bin179]
MRKVTVKNNCNKEEGETGGQDEGEYEGEPVVQVQVPDVAQQYLEDARAVVIGANLAVGEITYEYDSQVPEGYVISQHPAAGEVVNQATPVNLVVSKGARSCGCDRLAAVETGDMFLGLLGLIVLVVVTLCVQGGMLR